VERRALSVVAVVALLIVARPGIAPAGQAPDLFAAMEVLRTGTPIPVPDMAFRTLDGRPTRVSDLRGRPVVFTFFTTW